MVPTSNFVNIFFYGFVHVYFNVKVYKGVETVLRKVRGIECSALDGTGPALKRGPVPAHGPGSVQMTYTPAGRVPGPGCTRTEPDMASS